MSNQNKYIERASYTWSKDSIRLIMTPSTTARSIYFYLQEAGYFKTTPPYFTERKNLNSFLIVYTISGNGRLTYQNENYELTAGTCFYINCINYHYYKTPKNSGWEFLWIHFNGSSALGYYEEFTKNGFKILDIEDQFLIEGTIRRIISINHKRNTQTEILTSSLIINLLTELLLQNCTSHIQNQYLPDYLKSIIKDIEQNFRTKLSLDILSKNHGISKFYLSKEFKKYVGIPLNEYIINARLSYSKELLKYSELSVSEIAYQSGMNNVSHFINLFKNRENVTPLAYRKEWKI